MEIYTTGHITLTNGSAVVAGVLTGWDTALVAGGVIYPEAEGNPLPILSVDSDIAITAATKWQGVTGTYTYALVRDTAYLQQVSKNSSTLAQLVSELAAGTIFKYDASGDLVGRATYDERPKGFGYLVSIDVAQPQLYVKGSATSGDWDGPFGYGVGPMGPPTSLTFGATVTETPSTPASVVVTGAGPYNLTFHIPRGADGDITWNGDWTIGHNYTANQAVAHGGSSYVCTANHTAAAANEPGIGASWDAVWDLVASKGDKGDKGDLGDGDVTGPAAAVADNIAVYNGATGKLIKDGGISSAALKNTAKGLLWGLKFSNNAADAVNDIDIAAGVAADENNASPLVMILGAGVTRQLDAAFGTGNGGRFDAAISDGWWHVFLISNGVTTNVGLSKSLDPTTAPNYPAGYTSFRRILSIQRLSNALIALRQNGNQFSRGTPAGISAFTSTFPSQLIATGAPVGIISRPIVRITSSISTGSSSSTSIGDAAVGSANTQVQANFISGGGALVNIVDIFTTNTSGQLYFSSSISGTAFSYSLDCLGWTDTRGQL